MRFSTIFMSLLTVGWSIPIEPRQNSENLAPQLLETIKDLNTAVTDLTAAVNKFDGSLLGLLPQALAVVAAEAKVDVTILKATHITSKSSSFTAEQSLEIVLTLASQIEPISASLNALKAKYPVFKKTFTAPIVLLDLKILKAHTGDLISALKEKVTPDNAGLLDLGTTILNQAFDDAIAVYQG
ncbi:hydrophobic surface binding protein A-domain-containing protein [Pyrenochaeta sp. MPI-SDFR-AT-0127]|nr:hydrophobic surface binding protein A-domain-containing protein [Pyrenochaeta sp. MPI-SDFR-AT-0127]